MTEVLPAHPLDRRRIDSDVREMLRQPSTPWITFNRASRASGLAAGDVLPRRASVLEVLPPVAPPAPTTEPSTMAVASDVGTELPSVITTTPVVSEATLPIPRRGGWSPLSIAVIAAGLTLSAGLLVATSTYDTPARHATAAKTPPVAKPVPVKADAPPGEAPLTDLGAGLGSTSLGRSNAAEAPKDAKDAKDVKFGRLTIRGAAKSRNVFLDGKRLLGSGVRSFTVQCGAHVVSTQGREGGSSVEVPCNGELVVDR